MNFPIPVSDFFGKRLASGVKNEVKASSQDTDIEGISGVPLL
jgi:hypothetical protein